MIDLPNHDSTATQTLRNIREMFEEANAELHTVCPRCGCKLLERRRGGDYHCVHCGEFVRRA